MTVSREEIQRVKDEHDCREIAGEHIQLRGSGEKYGPCPYCGGDDRFHAKRDWWMCRHCHPKWSDVIDLVQWMDHISFHEALRRLGADIEDVQPTRLVKQPGHSTSKDAQTYIALRGITEETAKLYDVRYVTHYHTGEKRQEPALEIPWIDWDGNTSAYRYRFTENVNPKIVSAKGSKFAGLFFGILWPANPDSTLFVVEGEINAMSIRQVAGVGVDVVSVGSESVRPTDQMRKYVKQYKHCIVWMDRPDIGEQMAYDLWADAWISPDGYDANEVLGYGEDALKKMIDTSVANLV